MDQELKKLIKKNLELTKENHQMVKYIKKHIIFQQILGAIKILLIVVPLILGIIYLPPLIKDVFEEYRSLLGLESSTPYNTLDSKDIKKEDIPPDILKEICR